ncbi:MAG: ABC transporter substrate-binding protein [Candidatus Limnocylindrales bacterium]
MPTLRFAISGDPSGLLPPARDADTRRIHAFLYDSLYRLDEALRPVPVLAADQPAVSKDGRTWTIPIRDGLTFSDETPLDAGDVAGTLRLARSPACPFGDACRIAADHLRGVKVDGAKVVLTLSRPWSPLLTTLLADLPILPSDGLAASLQRLLAAAKPIDRGELAKAVDRIEAEVNAVDCDGDAPPASCSPAAHVAELRAWLARAGATVPRPERFADEAGVIDEAAYGVLLLAAVDALSEVLGRPGAGATPRPLSDASDPATDRLARALPLLDLATAPVGTGAYRLVSYSAGGRLVLDRRGPAEPGVPERVEAIVLRDAAEAATALQSGQVDWLPSVAPEVVPVLEADPALIVAGRPSGVERAIVFNVREGHPYADPIARQAFARCLDREALSAATLADRGLPASTLVAPESWAARPPKSRPGDPEAVRALLEEAGYAAGSDGVYERDGLRLASELIIRPGRAELAALMDAVAAALDTCGIELRVREVPFSPDVILPQLEWPNTFDTYLATIALGVDPALDLGWLAGSRVTTEKNPGDANFGGWRDKTTDTLLEAGEATLAEAKRKAAYDELQARLADLVPAWPLAHEAAYAAVSTGLVGADGGPIDPSRPGYEHGLLDWRLAPP